MTQATPDTALSDASTGPGISFTGIDPADIPAAIGQRIDSARQALDELLRLPEADWPTLDRLLGVPNDQLSRDWLVVQHLAAVNDSPALRKAIGETMPKVVEFWTQLGASAQLHRL